MVTKREVFIFSLTLLALVCVLLPLLLNGLDKQFKILVIMDNMRHIHIAAQRAAIEGQASGNPDMAWPGDRSTKSFTNYVGMLVKNDFIKGGDTMMFATPGYPTVGSFQSLNSTNSGINLYSVRNKEKLDEIFICSKTQPYVVIRKSGEREVFKSSDIAPLTLPALE